jgi:hypothetical protein
VRTTEALSPALVVADHHAPVMLSRVGAERLTAEIHADLTSAIGKLQAAREGCAHTALGYTHWHEYLLDRFGDLREFRLPVAERRAIVASMCDAGASVTDIVKAIGFSRGSIQSDREALGYAKPKPGTVVQLHEAPPVPTGPVWRQALTYLARQDDRGLTRIELAAEAGWSEGKAGGALADVLRRTCAARADVTRLNQRVFVVTDAGRAALEA